MGGLSGVAGYFWEDHTAFGAAFAHLLGAASPWAMAACAAVLLGLGLYQYRKARTAFRSWDGEDEDVMQRAEERLSWALLLDSLTVIVSFFFFNAGTEKLPQGSDVYKRQAQTLNHQPWTSPSVAGCAPKSRQPSVKLPLWYS